MMAEFLLLFSCGEWGITLGTVSFPPENLL